MNGKILISCGVLAMALAACSSPQQRALNRASSQAERTLDRLPSIGDPGRVAAADFAFARQARDEGQWTAFAATAAPGAMLHGPTGPILAAPWLAEQSDPEEAVMWAPNSVWSSCDGTLAVSFGRFQNAEGLVGSYVTAWQWQPRDRSYKWIYDIGAEDNPQPPPPEDPDIPEGAIIVPGMTAINGMIADCPPRGDGFAESALDMPEGVDFAVRNAADGSLTYRWEHHSNGTRRVVVGWMREGEWQTALDFTAPPPLEQ